MQYTMKQFAVMFDTTEHTLRYYTDVGLLPCRRDAGNRRVFDEESVNWMQGIVCLKGCGASIDDIKEYADLCRMPQSAETLRARYRIIVRQREEAHRRVEQAQATAAYMDDKVRHYEAIIAGTIPDDTNPGAWDAQTRPDAH